MSGKKTKIKRKTEAKKKLTGAMHAVAQGEPQKPVLAPVVVTRKLDLACGQTPQEGFEGVDIWPEAKIVHDLTKYPWPFEDNSIDEVFCSHYAEHIAMGYVDDKGRFNDGFGQPFNAANGQDALFRFFDEIWRILKPNGIAKIIVPCGRSNRGFQDPTHRRYFMAETFVYTNRDWRAMNKLDHYNVKCHFLGDVVPAINIELQARAPEVQALHFNSYWNSIHDWQATMKAIK